jgi:hypothetical protein
VAVSPEQAKALALAAARKRQAGAGPGTNESRSMLSQVGHDAAYAGGQLYKGAMTAITLPIDMLGGVINYLETKTQGPSYEVTIDGKKYTRQRGSAPTAAETVDAPLRAAGVPVDPENRTEEVLGSVYRSVGGAATGIGVGAGMAGAASPVVSGVGRTLAANPVLQTTSAVTGALSAEGAKEMGAGPGGQIVAGLAGAVAPSVVAAGTQALTRGAFRGGQQGRQRVADNINTFRTAGTTPTVGQATEGRVARGAESLMSRTPGGAGTIASRAESQADEVGAALEQRAQALVGRSTSAEQTGRQIEQAVSGSGGFVERFRATQKTLYDELDNHIAPTTPVSVSNTRAQLQALAAPVPGAAETAKRLANPRIASLAEGLELDAGTTGAIPYEALRTIRTRIGTELESGLVSDVPAAQWKRLYGAISEDLKAAATTPQAMAAWRRADNYTRAGMQRIEAIESVLNRNGGPEAIFRAATSGTREGASTLRSVMQSVDDEGQRMITATVLRRLGRAKDGVQGELGDRFSSETFLTNWSGLSTEAKRTLFNRYGDKFRSDMDQVAKFAANLRQGSQVFRNPSGTGQATVQASAATAFVGSLVLGHFGVAGTVAGGVLGANLTSRLMTNQNFVKWLAQSTKVPAGNYPAMVNRLAQEARSSGDMDLARAVALLEQQQPNNGGDQGEREQQGQ